LILRLKKPNAYIPEGQGQPKVPPVTSPSIGSPGLPYPAPVGYVRFAPLKPRHRKADYFHREADGRQSVRSVREVKMKKILVFVWVDPVQNLVVLKGGEDGDVRFKIHTTTTLKRRGKVVHLSKFQKGDKVTISYRVQRNTKIAAAVYL
jgi:hypothetical protein